MNLDSVWPAVTTGSPWVFIGVIIFAIISGRLIPRKTLEDRMRDKAEQIDQWRNAYENADKARTIQAEQLDKLLDQGRTTNVLLAALPRPPERP